jgi:hypothetical protein
MTDKQTILAFIDRINAHDVEGLAELMSDNHTFIDAHGNQVSGKEKMIAGWRGYFEWFPDYYIEVNEVFEERDALESDEASGVVEAREHGETFALFGFAGASFKGKQSECWRLPAAWQASVKDGRVTLWQVFADTKIPFEIIERNSQ